MKINSLFKAIDYFENALVKPKNPNQRKNREKSFEDAAKFFGRYVSVNKGSLIAEPYCLDLIKRKKLPSDVYSASVTSLQEKDQKLIETQSWYNASCRYKDLVNCKIEQLESLANSTKINDPLMCVIGKSLETIAKKLKDSTEIYKAGYLAYCCYRSAFEAGSPRAAVKICEINLDLAKDTFLNKLPSASKIDAFKIGSFVKSILQEGKDEAEACYELQRSFRLEREDAVGDFFTTLGAQLGNEKCLNIVIQTRFSVENAGELILVLQAAKYNSLHALNLCAFAFKKGQAGLAQDDKKAFNYFQEAANHPEATKFEYKNLANRHHFGKGISVNYIQAIKWYNKAISFGCEESKSMIAVIIDSLVQKEDWSTLSNCRELIKDTFSETYALILIQEENFEEALNFLLTLESQTIQNESYNVLNHSIGICYHQRSLIETEPNKKLALQNLALGYWIKQFNAETVQCAFKSIVAWNIACVYIDQETGSLEDNQKIIEYLEKSCELKNPQALNYLGSIYLNGMHGLEINLDKSKLLFKQAVELREPHAELNLDIVNLLTSDEKNNVDSVYKLYKTIQQFDSEQAIFFINRVLINIYDRKNLQETLRFCLNLVKLDQGLHSGLLQKIIKRIQFIEKETNEKEKLLGIDSTDVASRIQEEAKSTGATTKNAPSMPKAQEKPVKISQEEEKAERNRRNQEKNQAKWDELKSKKVVKSREFRRALGQKIMLQGGHVKKSSTGSGYRVRVADGFTGYHLHASYLTAGAVKNVANV